MVSWFETLIILVLLLTLHQVSLYDKVANNFDLYGNKIGMNDRLLVTGNNLDVSFNIQLSPFPSETTCKILTRPSVDQTNGQTSISNASCDLIYSVIVAKHHPLNEAPYFVYNCVDQSGNNVIGVYSDVSNQNSCQFELQDSRIVGGNYSTQDNFVLSMASDGTGVYGIADDFLMYYNLSSFEIFIVPLIGFGLSPRAFEIIMSQNSVFAVVAGYLQMGNWGAQEMVYLVSLNPIALLDSFRISSTLDFPLGDPRRNRWVANNRVYSLQNSMSVSIASRTGQVLVGVQSLNTVLLLGLDNATNPTGFIDNSSLVTSKQNGIGMGYGKSVAWLDDDGQKAAILANNYSYSTYQWISSSVHVYDIGTDGFNDSSQPIIIYPNSQQVLQPQLSPSFIRLVSSSGHVALFDDLGTSFVLLSSPPGAYPTTLISGSFSVETPCIRGTYSDQDGIELCIPCPNGTYSSAGAIHCSVCSSRNGSYCTYGAVAPINYEDIDVVDPEEAYPESPENTIFDDILLANMFTLSSQSGHCSIVSPLTWVLVVIGVALITLILMGLLTFYPRSHPHRKRIMIIAKHMDLIGEGKMWIGGSVSAGIIVFLAFAYAFSSAYYQRYPIEKVGSSPWFGCHQDMTNAKFSSSMQMLRLARFTDDNQIIFSMLDQQPFTLWIDLINTAFMCNDSIIAQRVFSNKVTPLQITSCKSTYNSSILSLDIPLPVRAMSVQLILPGVRTVGVIRLGLKGPGMTNDDGRITRRELSFATVYAATETDHILSPLVDFSIQMTAVVNQTAPLNPSASPRYSCAWSFFLEPNSDQWFTVETRYTFYKRQKTVVSVTLTDTVFSVSNVQQPIARGNEIIFRNLLFTVVVLELFRLAFLIFKIMFLPLFRLAAVWLSKHKKQIDSIGDKKTSVQEKDSELTAVSISEDRNPIVEQPLSPPKIRQRSRSIPI